MEIPDQKVRCKCMNLLHMKYAVEVVRQGSLSRAAETLHTAQPNISRAIKELEKDIGITLFQRSKRGMLPTPEGEEFVGYAREVLSRLDEMESLYRQGIHPKRRFVLASPTAPYISEAMALLADELGEAAFDIQCRRMSVRDTIRSVENGEIGLGLIRYPAERDAEIKSALREKGINGELVAEFSPVVLLNRLHPLAASSSISPCDLVSSIAVMEVGGDPFTGTEDGSLSEAIDGSLPGRRIVLPEYTACMDVLAIHTDAYMWSIPMDELTLARHDLVAVRPIGGGVRYKDILLFSESHRLTWEEKQFVTALTSARRCHMPS